MTDEMQVAFTCASPGRCCPFVVIMWMKKGAVVGVTAPLIAAPNGGDDSYSNIGSGRRG